MPDSTQIPRRWVDLTASDTAVIVPTIGLYIGTGGSLVGVGLDGVSATYQPSAGTYLTGRFTAVRATGTTASGIVALYGV